MSQAFEGHDGNAGTHGAPRPYTLIAELTYRCALKCPYCSNPTDLRAHRQELTTAEWLRALEDAEALGVVQVHFSGGEPLARKDLEPIVQRARELGLYSNLVTSGVPLARERLVGLKAAGIDHVQVSFQGTKAELADAIAGYEGHEQKLRVARWVKELGLPLTINVVLHRANLEEVEAIIDLAENLGADRVELANTQYHAWAMSNRDALLPSPEQLESASAVAARAKARLRGKMDVLFVKPDYFSSTPKACMDGWARRFVHMTPDGFVLPCHAAMEIKTLSFESVRQRPLGDIWTDSPALRAYRGDAWMPEPCKSCERKTIDFGGCRCQAFALTGDPDATDPVCALSPHHDLVLAARATAKPRRYLYRG
ncbi:pyrroloquinoline quinone biosynthesis protein PqqE [Pendulispora albinea]|uniref:PqqA peptide cyclase n=1 Tax=Pendulispora albinea TaxID=2741071 RepID=A0ABZ2LX78_9BACT